MFDTAKEIEITIYSGGPKTCVVGWPADADWKRRAKQIRFKNEAAGRDKTRSSVIGAEPAALEMLEKIRKDAGEPFDGAEALEVIGRLEHCELCEGAEGEPSIDVRGDRITVRLAALQHKGRALVNGMVHTLRHPTMRQMRDYRSGCVDMYAVRRGTESTQPLAPGEAMFDAIVEKSEGYAAGIPVTHKDFVVCRILEAIKDLEEEGGA